MNAERTPEYQAWRDMQERCFNSKGSGWHNYGGRGITVCERWRTSFDDFLADMGPKPSRNLTLDRINNDGNYEPGNCRWATKLQQARNRRTYKQAQTRRERRERCRQLIADGLSFEAIARELGASLSSVWRIVGRVPNTKTKTRHEYPGYSRRDKLKKAIEAEQERLRLRRHVERIMLDAICIECGII